MITRWREGLSTLAPVAVLGTLICCALPILLVALGAGSVVASLVSAAPWLVALSRSKDWVFLVAGALLAADYWILYRSTSGSNSQRRAYRVPEPRNSMGCAASTVDRRQPPDSCAPRS